MDSSSSSKSSTIFWQIGGHGFSSVLFQANLFKSLWYEYRSSEVMYTRLIFTLTYLGANFRNLRSPRYLQLMTSLVARMDLVNTGCTSAQSCLLTEKMSVGGRVCKNLNCSSLRVRSSCSSFGSSRTIVGAMYKSSR